MLKGFHKCFLKFVLTIESNEISRYLFSINAYLNLNKGIVSVILNRPEKYETSVRPLKTFDKGTEIKSRKISNILAGVSR